jgi:hypothetical protein
MIQEVAIFSFLFLGIFQFFDELKLYILLGVLILLWKPSLAYLTSRPVVAFSILIFVYNVLSQLSGLIYLGVFNVSWFVQVSLFSAFPLIIYNALRKMPENDIKILLKSLLTLLSLTQIIVCIITLISFGVPSDLLDQQASYARLAQSTSVTGVYKFVLPLMSFCVYLILRKELSKLYSVVYLAGFILYVIAFLVKTIIVGLLFVMALILLRKIAPVRHRVKIFLISIVFIFVFFFIYYDEVTAISVMNGRYIFPILTSPDYFLYPFGVGFGNYSTAMEQNIIALNYTGPVNIDLLKHLGLDVSDAFRTSESDLLQLGVGFGWSFLLIYTCYFLVLISKFLHGNKGSELPIIFFISSGFFQDYTNMFIGWVLFSHILAIYYTIGVKK